jgi:hypothetical protein
MRLKGPLATARWGQLRAGRSPSLPIRHRRSVNLDGQSTAADRSPVGFAFRTGAQPIRVTDLGQYHLPPTKTGGNAVALCAACPTTHAISLYQMSAGADTGIECTTLNGSDLAASAPAQYQWGTQYTNLQSSAVCDEAAGCDGSVVLNPNTTYVLLSAEGKRRLLRSGERSG